MPISDLKIKLDGENPWLKRLIKIGQLVLERWEGRVLVSTPDIGVYLTYSHRSDQLKHYYSIYTMNRSMCCV